MKDLFIMNWQRKLAALIIACLIWLFVHHSISETKTIDNVPIRIVNRPNDKTIIGLQPNGLLAKRITLTLNGSKGVIDALGTGDVEVLLDASTLSDEQSLLQISNKNLISLNPEINLSEEIELVSHSDYPIKLSKMITAKVPVKINTPRGEAPQGYVFLDIWPQKLYQNVTGPEEQVLALMAEGITVQFDLGSIAKSDLDKIQSSRANFHDDEVSFPIPIQWKKVPIPFRNNSLEEMNDPKAKILHFDFLRKETLPINTDLPVTVFYPIDTSKDFNPANTPLLISGSLQEKNGIAFLPYPLYVHNVSKLFLEVIRDHMEIVITASQKPAGESLNWSLQVVNAGELENIYVAKLVDKHPDHAEDESSHSHKRESHLRDRFQNYVSHLNLYVEENKRFHLDSRLINGKIIVMPLPAPPTKTSP